jgi:hypothetical protein
MLTKSRRLANDCSLGIRILSDNRNLKHWSPEHDRSCGDVIPRRTVYINPFSTRVFGSPGDGEVGWWQNERP